MRTIHKYPLGGGFITQLNLCHSAKILTVKRQGDQTVLWAEVEPDETFRPVRIFCIGTGHPMPGVFATYISTVQHDDLVFHYYVEGAYGIL